MAGCDEGAILRYMRDPNRDRSRKTLLQIDEFGYLTQVEALARLAATICKVARKYGIGLVAIDQNPITFLGSENGRYIFENALNAAGEAIIAAGGDLDAAGASVPVVGGRVQGLAMRYGAGRIVVLGEAGMLSAQRVTFPDDPQGRRTMRFGMNVAGIDNRQFVLNLLHWLSGALD